MKFDSRALLYLGVFGVVAAISFSRELSDAVAYDRHVFDLNYVWMLLTCHLTHLSVNHTLVNLAGIGLLLLAFSGEVSAIESAGLMLVCALVTGLGIHWFSTDIDRYYGFSGVIHGVLVGELLITIRRLVLLHSLVIVGVIGKVLYEWFGFGNLMSSADFIGGYVAVDAHFYGLLAGLLTGSARLLFAMRKTSTNTMA